MRPLYLLAALPLLLTTPALAQSSFVVVCTAPCIAGDGTTQPIGTVLNRILAAPGFNPGPGLALAPDTGQGLYAQAPTVPTSLPSLVFLQRLTTAELTAIGTGSPGIGLIIVAEGTVSNTSPVLLAQFANAVSQGWVTPARAAQILNFAVSSP
jgi:hypothetical protein